MVTEVNGKEELEAKLKEAGDKLVVVEFYAKWCGSCKKMGPQFEALVQVYPNVVMLQVETEKNMELTQEYEVQNLPTFVLIKKGEVVSTLATSKLEGIKNLIKEKLMEMILLLK